MLTEVKAYSSWLSAPTILLDENGRAETDLVQIRNVDGLDPVKASVNTSLFGSVDGSAYTGASVDKRNIVLTLHPNPDWDLWSFENLRRLLYSYFMPKRALRLVFYSDDMIPVEISGIVEDVQANQFSKDPELIVSVVCPDPYFTALEPVVITGQANAEGPEIVEYNGSVEAGIHVKVSWVSGAAPTSIGIGIGSQNLVAAAAVNSSLYFEMNSLPMQKYVQNINIGSGVITNLLPKVQEGSKWPMFQPGENEFSVVTTPYGGVQDFELTYYERFGGL